MKLIQRQLQSLKTLSATHFNVALNDDEANEVGLAIVRFVLMSELHNNYKKEENSDEIS